MKSDKKLIIERIKNILYSGKPVLKSDTIFLIDIFKKHPSFKLSLEVDSIEVGKDIFGFNTNCFYINYKDNTRDDISYLKAINGIDENEELDKLVRNTIMDIISDFRDSIKKKRKYICAISKKQFNPKIDKFHVIYNKPTLLEIANEYIKKVGIDNINVGVTEKTYKLKKYNIECILNDDFIEFFNKRANPQICLSGYNGSFYKKMKKKYI